ncbi:MAG: ATP-binding protein [Spirosomataceae bacterium]
MKFMLPFMVAFFLIPFVQKFLQTAHRLPLWHERLKIGRIAAFVLIGIEVVIQKNFISSPVFFGLLLLCATPAYLLKEEIQGAKLLLWMIVPFGLVFLVDNLAHYWIPTFHKNQKGFFDSAKLAALIVGVVTAIMARNQQKSFEKALNEERLKRQHEEEANRILEAKKLDLETQVAARTAELLQQKEELLQQKEELQKAIETLKATQQQLIQSEKLASLGELTAGIAHEIQNPLNFVNNFSEVSGEIIQELVEEVNKPPISQDLVLKSELLADLAQNLEKITHHGKRASNIVTGMLQHSRTSTGEKDLTDLNALADEYLRLSYHGLRAKDKSFNATLITDFDPNLPKIEVIPQDIGRVLLNLINNAFYATQQRFRPLDDKVEDSPKVTVSTQTLEKAVEIRVKDNGVGMSEEVKAKMFQPFFTTKPTGQGTGLGLSLAYDIITKGHGGTIDVESVEGEGTTFVIKLPF